MKSKLTFLLAITFLFIFNLTHAQLSIWLDEYGNEMDDVSNNVVLDQSGNIYVTGSFNSPTLTIGSTTLTNSGGWDVFVAKYNPGGTPIWAVNADGANADEFGNDITVDESGNVYVIGSFQYGDISFDGGSTTLTNSGGSDFFVVKFNSSGTHQWSFTNSGGGGKDEFGNGIDFGSGALYIIGSFISPDLEIDGIPLTNSGMFDVFWGKVGPSGGVSHVENPIGEGNDYGKDIAVNESDEIYITGFFESSTLAFPGITLTNTGLSDIFVARVSTSTPWAQNPEGDKDDRAYGVEIDETGNVYITGDFESGILTFDGATDIFNPTVWWGIFSNYFIAKYTPGASTEIQWAKTAWANTYPDNNFDDVGKDLAVDNAGYVYVTGWYNSRWIDFGLGEIMNATNDNYSEIFVAKYNADDGNILWLAEGHAVYNSHGTGIDVLENDCPVITGWFESTEVPFAGSMLTNAGPEETADFYVGKICEYQCDPTCDDEISETVAVLNTGMDGIAKDDSKWQIVTDASGGTVPRPAVGSFWYEISPPPTWSYSPPMTGTNWISVDSIPDAPVGIYEFQTTFVIDSFCSQPRINLCVMVDEEAEVYLNGVHIGSASSFSTPVYITAEDYPTFLSGLNTLSVVVENTISAQMALNIRGYVCCQSDPCDFVSVGHQPGNTECCHEIYLQNHDPLNTIENITISAASPTINSVTGLPNGGFDIEGPPVFPTSTFTLENTTAGTGNFNVHFNMCIDPTASNPQQLIVQWVGYDQEQYPVICTDTLYLECPDSICCDSCEYPLQTIVTGSGDWSLISAPAGVPIGPAVSIPIPHGDWGDPFDGTSWISYSSNGGGAIAPAGIYTFNTEFCVCEDCPENKKMYLKMCGLVDDTAVVYLNGSYIGTLSSELFSPSSSVIEVVSPPFFIGGSNEITVDVINNPAYYTAFDARIWICCEEMSGIDETNFHEEVKVYPNPAYDYLNIESVYDIESVKLYNFTGQLMRSQNTITRELKLNIGDLQRGVYMLQINTSGKKVITKKVMKN